MKYDITSMTRDNGHILVMMAYTRESDGKRRSCGHVVPDLPADAVAGFLSTWLRAEVNRDGVGIVDLDVREDEPEEP